MEESNPELESFRQQWRAEVSARSKSDDLKGKGRAGIASRPPRKPPATSSKSTSEPSKTEGLEEGAEEDSDEDGPKHQTSVTHKNQPVLDGEDVQGFADKSGSREPRSALEHYEKAVERENQGSLGDSLNLYRKAFKVSGPKLEKGLTFDVLHRWITASISNIKTNTFLRRTLPQNQITPTHRMRARQCLTLLTTL